MRNASPPSARTAGTRRRPRPGSGTTDQRARRRRIITWMLIAGVSGLLINAIVGENGYLATLRLRRTEVALTNALARVRIENHRLQEERIRLQSDPDALEQAIRKQLGFIRPGEVAVIVRETPKVSAAPGE